MGNALPGQGNPGKRTFSCPVGQGGDHALWGRREEKKSAPLQKEVVKRWIGSKERKVLSREPQKDLRGGDTGKIWRQNQKGKKEDWKKKGILEGNTGENNTFARPAKKPSREGVTKCVDENDRRKKQATHHPGVESCLEGGGEKKAH